MSLTPTFEGWVAETHDALILFQAVIDGVLEPVSRRPHDKERDKVIRSGSVFIFDEKASGIQRWTDGISWSPSRISGNFLLYRQLPGQSPEPYRSGSSAKSRRQKRGSASGTYSNKFKEESMGQYGWYGPQNSPISSSPASYASPAVKNSKVEWSLLGSLVDESKFKSGGLMKKTISLRYRNALYRLISYYKPQDIREGHFIVPSKCEQLKDVRVADEVGDSKHFRMPINVGHGDDLVYGDVGSGYSAGMPHSLSGGFTYNMPPGPGGMGMGGPGGFGPPLQGYGNYPLMQQQPRAPLMPSGAPGNWIPGSLSSSGNVGAPVSSQEAGGHGENFLRGQGYPAFSRPPDRQHDQRVLQEPFIPQYGTTSNQHMQNIQVSVPQRPNYGDYYDVPASANLETNTPSSGVIADIPESRGSDASPHEDAALPKTPTRATGTDTASVTPVSAAASAGSASATPYHTTPLSNLSGPRRPLGMPVSVLGRDYEGYDPNMAQMALSPTSPAGPHSRSSAFMTPEFDAPSSGHNIPGESSASEYGIPGIPAYNYEQFN